MDVERRREGHSCVGDSGNVWVLLEVVGFLGMRVENAQLGYIVDKSLSSQWFKASVVSRRSGIDTRAFHLLQVFDAFFYLI